MKVHGNVKCDCGHTAKFHYLSEGCCDECACTWHHPNVYYIKKNTPDESVGTKHLMCRV